jgi:U3 small nucleolar RNA-associated protein 20
VSTVLAFSVSLIHLKWSHYTQILLPHILKYCASNWGPEHSSQIIVFLATLLTSDILVLTPGMIAATVDSNGLLKFPVGKTSAPSKKSTKSTHDNSEAILDGILRILSTPCDWRAEAEMLSNVSLEDEERSTIPRIALVTAALSIVPQISSSFESTSASIVTLLGSLLTALSKEDQSITLQKRPFVQGSSMATLHILLGETIEVLAVICERNGAAGTELLSKQWDVIIEDALFNYGSNEVVLRGVAKYCTILKDR